MRSRLRHTGAGLVVLSALLVAGCQGEGSDPAPATETAPTGPATDAAATTTESSPTTAAATETTTGSDEDRATTAPAAAPTSTEPTTAPTEDEPTEDEPSEEPVQDEATEDSGDAAGDLVIVREGTVFTTPAQAAFCSLSAPTGGMAAVISCEVAQSSVPPGEELMGICPSDGYGWYFNFFEDSGHGGFWCNHHDGIVHSAGVDLADEPWVDQGQVHVLSGGTRVPILGYGRVLRAGGLSCSVQPDGLTCNNPESGHGFTVNSASYASW